jgi:hypothetical protein
MGRRIVPRTKLCTLVWRLPRYDLFVYLLIVGALLGVKPLDVSSHLA